MSELSSAYTEYEKVSGLLRQLNEAALVVRQTLLGIDPPPVEEQNQIRDRLDRALEQLTQGTGAQEAVRISEGLSLADLLKQVPDEDEEISPQTVAAIRGRIKGGLSSMTDEDIEIIERITAALESASESLFRRIQK